MKRIFLIYLAINLVFSNLCFSKVTPKNGEDKIVIKEGDTLWDIARRYYKDPELWPKFNEYNLIENPDLIYPGEKLAIGKSLALSLADAMMGRMKRLEGEKVGLKKKITSLKEEITDLKKEIEALKLDYEERIADLKKGLPQDEELRFKHQAEIEVMESEVLVLQDKITTSHKEKAGLEVLLSARIVELGEKEKEIKRREDEIKMYEDKLQLGDDEIAMLRTGIFELEEKLKVAEKEIGERDKKIKELKNEKGVYTSLAHFLIFILVSGIFALNTIN